MQTLISPLKINKIINIFLRSLTLLSKVFLIFFLAKYFEPNQLGLFGLIMATIGFSVYAVGLDFYTYTTRELLKYNKKKWGHFLKSQCLLHFLLYLITFPLILTLFIFKIMPWNLVVLFFLILFFEHVTLELSRLLITLNNQINSSVVIFFRSGFWCVGISLLMFFFEKLRTIEYILLSWIFSLIIALIISLFFLNKINIGGWDKSLNYKWIKKGLNIAIPFLISTLIIRAIFTLDRYWIEFHLGSDILGVYVLFIGFVSSILTFMDAGVFSFSYPVLVKSFNLKNKKIFSKESQLLKKNTIIFSFLSLIIALIFIKPILQIIDRPIYLENIFIFYCLLLVIIIYILSMIPHYLLYAQRYDRIIINSHIITFIIFVSTTWFFSKIYIDYSVLLGLGISFTFLLIYKTFKVYSKNDK
jgi:O-antigen/teichoic acid export membrane protein